MFIFSAAERFCISEVGPQLGVKIECDQPGFRTPPPAFFFTFGIQLLLRWDDSWMRVQYLVVSVAFF